MAETGTVVRVVFGPCPVILADGSTEDLRQGAIVGKFLGYAPRDSETGDEMVGARRQDCSVVVVPAWMVTIN